MTADRRWLSWPRLALAAPEGGRLAAHLAAEYGPPVPGAGDPCLKLLPERPSAPAWSAGGGHKGTRWELVVTAPERRPMEAWVRVRGPFGLPLIQSQVLEPLLAAAVADADRALVPAAALRHDGLVELVVGDSGAGKTTLAMRALGAGWDVLGDDRVFVGSAGVEGFRRRHRVYPDARQTAPAFVERLTAGDRRELDLRTAVARLTRGFVRLPVLVDPPAQKLGAVDVGRMTLLVRDTAPNGWLDDIDSLAARLGAVIDRDRRALARLSGPWPEAFQHARALELEALRRAARGVPVRLVVSPTGPPADAIARVAAVFGLPE